MVIWYIVFGLLGGVVGGMGMGGGTLLIPLLVIFGGVAQGLSQGINLLSFIPMSGVSLLINHKQGLVKGKDIIFIIIPAVLTSIAGAVLANFTDTKTLQKFFGIFLVLLGVFFLQNTLKKTEKDEKRD